MISAKIVSQIRYVTNLDGETGGFQMMFEPPDTVQEDFNI
jgi:hypothetical protein